MKISVFGLGYVGCVSLGCLAKNGHNVIGVDVVQHKVDLINEGKPTIIEKDIDAIIRDEWLSGKVSATLDYKYAIENTEVSIICVGTPSSEEGHLNLNYIFETAVQIAEGLKSKDDFHVVVIRSTVMPGTNKKVGDIIEQRSGKRLNYDFAVVSNPEFLREGSAVKDYYNPAVTVLGSSSEKALNIMDEIYRDINAPIKHVDIEVAEIIKYVNNSFHALKITFANEVGNIAKKLGIDSHAVMDLFCMDDILNLSAYYFKPGFAYGGSCLPKDLKGLNTLAHDLYLKVPVISSIESSNEIQKENAFNLIEKAGNKSVSILGLSFKSGTDDLRYSPIVNVAEKLLGKGYTLKIYDKNVNYSKLTGTNKAYIDKFIPHLSSLISDDLEDIIKNTDTVVINHKLDEVVEVLEKYPNKIIIDLVNIKSLVSFKEESNYNGICW